MEPGPIPPHERSWRHPSELGPTPTQVQQSVAASRQTKVVALSAALLAVAAIAVVVVAATPRQSPGPVALSATTTPAGAAVSDRSTDLDGPLLASFTPIPNEISSAPVLVAAPPEHSEQLPDADDPVVVQTPEVTYHCTWGDVRWIEMPEGTIVIDAQGGLVAVSDGDELVTVVDD